MVIERINTEEGDQQINYYHLIRLDRPSVEEVYNFLAFLNKIARNTVSAKLTFLQNPQENEFMHKIIDCQLVDQQLSKLWKQIWSQPSKQIISEFRLFLNEAVSSAFMESVCNDVTQELLKIQQYSFYERQVQILAVKSLYFCVSNYIKIMQKYDQVLSELQYFVNYQSINKASQYLKSKQNHYLQQLKQLKNNIIQLQTNLYKQHNKQKIVSSSCQKVIMIIPITIFLFSLPIFMFGLVNFEGYGILTQHWNLWVSSGSYFVYCWINIALYQYSLTKRVHPFIGFKCQSPTHQILLQRQFMWCTLLIETTLFLWLFMAYLFFYPTQFLPMAANCLAVLCFCFEVAYGIYHMEIIEALMFKCSFYEFAAMFPVVSEVVFNSGIFLLFEAECSRNNAFQKLVYLIGTLSIVLIHLSYFYHMAEGGQKMSKLRQQIQQKRKQQRQLKNQIKEKKKSLQPIVNNFNQTLSSIQQRKRDLLSTLNSMNEFRRQDRAQAQISTNNLYINNEDIPNYVTTNRMNQNQQYEPQQLRRNLQVLQQQQRQLTFSNQVLLEQQLGKYERQLNNIQQILTLRQNQLQYSSKQLRQQQTFGIFYFFIIIIQIGFLFDQSDAIVVINMLLSVICLVFLGRRRILFLFDLLQIKCKIILKTADQSQPINKNTFNLCLDIFGLTICLLSNIAFIFGANSCYFGRLLGWRRYILLGINSIVYIMHNIIVINTTAELMRHPLSGLISTERLKQLQQNSNKLINGLRITPNGLKEKAMVKEFEERRKAANRTLSFQEKMKVQQKKLKQIKHKMDLGQLRAFIKSYQQ